MASPTDHGKQRRFTYAFQDPANALAHNGVELVSIYGIHVEKPFAPFTFSRSQGSPNAPHILDYYLVRGPEPPERLPSSLPPPGNLSMRLNLGRRLGHGRAGSVYTVTVDFANSTPELTSVVFPPLVAKISHPNRETEIEHEAFYYDEMESIQGIVIPRCYGYFRGEIPQGYTLVGEPDLSREGQTILDMEDSDSDTAQRFQSQRTTSNGSRVISILLLEQLGDRLPISRPEEIPDDIQGEILNMYSHLVQLGVDHVDIRYANILEAPVCPPGWPSLMSPLTNNAYRYRLVDFGNSCKTNRAVKLFSVYYRSYVRRLLNGLKMGYIIEPWQL
ncbi:hypothetical protein NM688_g7037 [Phlebia brevispora]|uniref:Uncharacterized protein n=1 Tax=Phlebia brevispora TaxID=194682 RepID=A0ACC1SA60_9APHY|nr:hypothetical protein NM688_g7037 [Phlebia brevispora]